MSRSARFLAATTLIACLFCLTLLSACSGPVEGLVGQYESDAASGGAARLSLRSDGGGGLAAGPLDEPLRWEIREDRVLLHTLRGEVVSLARTGQGLEGEVPGLGRITLRKK